MEAPASPSPASPGAPRPRRVICLAGPTGAGKTALALRLAGELGGEIVNADSRQAYRDFPIITAQPTPGEREQAPHHLYGYLETQERGDTADWARRALAVIGNLEERGKLPILVGGTGFYFQTLLRGIADIPVVPADIHEAMTARARAQGAPALHAELSRIDPVYAAKIHPNDTQRAVRALEVHAATGRPISWWHENAACAPSCRGPLLVADTPLARLEGPLARRIDTMLDMGALDEGRRALERCPDENAPGWSGIGCREVLGHLLGRLSLEAMKEAWYRNTRAYAKRQVTWFRGRAEARWIDVTRPDDVLALCRELLAAGDGDEG